MYNEFEVKYGAKEINFLEKVSWYYSKRDGG